MCKYLDKQITGITNTLNASCVHGKYTIRLDYRLYADTWISKSLVLLTHSMHLVFMVSIQ